MKTVLITNLFTQQHCSVGDIKIYYTQPIRLPPVPWALPNPLNPYPVPHSLINPPPLPTPPSPAQPIMSCVLTELPMVVRASLARRSLVSSCEMEKAWVMWLQNSTEIPTACPKRGLSLRMLANLNEGHTLDVPGRKGITVVNEFWGYAKTSVLCMYRPTVTDQL